MTTENETKSPADKYREELFTQFYFLDRGGEGYLGLSHKEYRALLDAEWERVK